MNTELVFLAVFCAACATAPPSPVPAEHEVQPVPASRTPDEDPAPVSARDEDASAPVAETGPCVGNAPPELLRKIQQRAAETRRCYESALRKNPSLTGRMLMMLRIDADGRVGDAQLEPGAIDDEEMRDCVLSMFQSAFTPAPENGCVKVNIPLLFKPKPKPDASVP